MRSRLLAFLVLVALLPFLTGATIIIRGPRVAAGGPTYLINQNFEGTGYDNGESWTESAGDVNEDNTSSPILGSQDLMVGIATSGSAYSYAYTTFTGQTTAHLFFKVKPGSWGWNASADDILVAHLANTSGTAIAGIVYNADGNGDGTIKLYANGAAGSASAVKINRGETWNVWITFISSGTCVLAASQSTTKPSVDGSGNIYLEGTGASDTAARAYLGNGSAGSSAQLDHVLVSASTIGDNP